MSWPKSPRVAQRARVAAHAWWWRRHCRGFYRQFVDRGGLCFDIGANRGDRAAILLAIPARVVAVEPQSICHGLLEARFASRRGLTLVRAAVGSAPGEADLLVADDQEASVLATLSQQWIDSVRASGRFSRFSWTPTERVSVTTLDALIDRFGEPQFCKIDVEGYEHEVLLGLTTAIRALSLEFTPERMETTVACVGRLLDLGDYEFNYSLNESLVLASHRWMTAYQLHDALALFWSDTVTFGDVYARLIRGKTSRRRAAPANAVARFRRSSDSK